MAGELGDLAWPEVPRGAILAVPVGATEQHGAHLPLSIGNAATELVLLELGRSATQSVERVVFVSAHGGDARPVRRARPLAQLMPALVAGGVRAVSENGVLGDPAGATAATGERLLAEATHDLLRAVGR